MSAMVYVLTGNGGDGVWVEGVYATVADAQAFVGYESETEWRESKSYPGTLLASTEGTSAFDVTAWRIEPHPITSHLTGGDV